MPPRQLLPEARALHLSFLSSPQEVPMSGSVPEAVSSAPPAPRSRGLTVVAGLLAAADVAVLAKVVVAFLAHAAGASEDFDPLHLSAYAPLTVFGVALGAIGWAVVRRIAKNPAGLLRW